MQLLLSDMLAELNAKLAADQRINPDGFAHPGTYVRIYELHRRHFPNSESWHRYSRLLAVFVILLITTGAFLLLSALGFSRL